MEDTVDENKVEDTLVSDGYYKEKKNPKDMLFLKELEVLPLSKDIKNEAFIVYKKMKITIKRKNNRNWLKFFCAYNACLNLNKIRDPNHLANMCGVKPNELSKVLKMFSFENTGYRMKDIDITPLDYLSDYYKATELRTDGIDELIELATEVLKKETFAEEFPQVVAAAMIYYYVWKLHNILLSQKFFEYVGRSETVIRKLVDKIGVVYNS